LVCRPVSRVSSNEMSVASTFVFPIVPSQASTESTVSAMRMSSTVRTFRAAMLSSSMSLQMNGKSPVHTPPASPAMVNPVNSTPHASYSAFVAPYSSVYRFGTTAASSGAV